VILEKINETMTRGPLADARKNQTNFSLYDYDFPLRMMWLKQRVGRLIRSTTDRGVVVLFDSRYHNWGENSRDQVRQTVAPIPVRVGSRDDILMEIEKLSL
jgi:Rad3-related DNA helicase